MKIRLAPSILMLFCFGATMTFAQGLVDLDVAKFRFLDETIHLDFTSAGQTTSRIYSGAVRVEVTGYGNSQGARLNDAFYIYNEVDANGNLLDPFIREPYLLYVDVGAGPVPVTSLLVDETGAPVLPPPFNMNHRYQLIIDTGAASAITFRIGDDTLTDNTGGLLIQIVNEDLNGNGTLEPPEDLNGNGILDNQDEDLNGNGLLDAGEDVNANGSIDFFSDSDADGIADRDVTVEIGAAYECTSQIGSFTFDLEFAVQDQGVDIIPAALLLDNTIELSSDNTGDISTDEPVFHGHSTTNFCSSPDDPLAESPCHRRTVVCSFSDPDDLVTDPSVANSSFPGQCLRGTDIGLTTGDACFCHAYIPKRVKAVPIQNGSTLKATADPSNLLGELYRGNNTHSRLIELDGDGIRDRDDHCPATAGVVEFFGCTAANDVEAASVSVGIGSHPGVTTNPIADLTIAVYDKSPGSCVASIGINPGSYPAIVDICAPVRTGRTNSNGRLLMGSPVGDFLMIGLHHTGTETVFLGTQANNISDGELNSEYLRELVRANGTILPAKITKVPGSLLLVVEPEQVTWSSPEELYPFAFEAVGDWQVETSVSPPEGFVADYDSLSTVVPDAGESAVQFTIFDIGSEWVPTKVRHKIRHNGRQIVLDNEIGVAMTPEFAAKKREEATQKGRGRGRRSDD